MPKVLILDIEGSRFTLLPATTGRSLIVDPPRFWDDDKGFLPAAAEAQGRAFRDRLAGFGIAPAPLVIGIGRDRLVLKEIKFPPVPEHDEPGVVRFQALKELTDAGDDIVIDYQPRGDAVSGEKRALVVALKRDLMKAIQAFAQGAGIKVLAIVPRAYGLMAAVRAAADAPDPAAGFAAMAISGSSGEFVLARGGQLLFNRAIAGPALASDTSLAGEVRRNLAVHNSQSSAAPVAAVYVAEGSSPSGVVAKLRESLPASIHALTPLARLDVAGGAPGESAAAVGLARLIQAGGELPINFIKPREPKPAVDPTRRPILIGAAVAAALLIGCAMLAYFQVSSKDRQIAQLNSERDNLQSQLDGLEFDKRRGKALEDWLNTEVVWLDEFYDLTARFPDITKLRVVQLNADPLPLAGKSKYVGRMQIKGVATSDAKPLEQLTKELVAEGTYRVEPKSQSANTLGVERGTFPLQFLMRYDVERRPREKFTRTFNAEPPAKRGGSPSGSGFDFLNLLGPGR